MQPSTSALVAYELFTLTIIGVLLADGSYHFLGMWKNRSRVSRALIALSMCWLLIVAFVLSLWPNCSYPSDYPLPSFLFLAAISALLFTKLLNATKYQRLARALLWILAGTGCVFLVFKMLQYFVFIQPRIAGADFFYYVVVARHMLFHSIDFPMREYFYFPGIFNFWKAALLFFDGNLTSLQWAYAAVIALNSTLIGAIVYRTVRNILAGVVSAAWYVFFCSHFEGFAGIAEPIATAPVLMALFAWGGKPLTGRAGLFRIIALGAGLGLSIYVRQYAGLISLGALSLLITYLIQDKQNPIVTFRTLIILPLTAAAVTLVGILMEGYGLQPLQTGIQGMPQYGLELRPHSALLDFYRKVPLFALLTCLSVIVWIVPVMQKRFRAQVTEPWWQIVTFCWLGGLCALLSFLSRSSLHYALFTGGLWILAVSISVVICLRAVPQVYSYSRVFAFLLICLMFLPFIRTQSRSGFYAWPPEAPVRRVKQIPWYAQPRYLADVARAKQMIEPMEEIYVLPPSENHIHFFLNTRYATYGWNIPVQLEDVLKSGSLQGVVVLQKESLSEFYRGLAERQFDLSNAEEILKRHSYQPVLKLRTFVLWRKLKRAE